MSDTTRTADHDVPWEESWGYVQARRVGDVVYLSGQVSHDGPELVAPAPVADGRASDTGNTAAQMRQCYVNAATLLARFGATLDDVVDETLFVIDPDVADAVGGDVRREAYGRARPQVTSTVVGVPRLAFPELLVEIKLVAHV